MVRKNKEAEKFIVDTLVCLAVMMVMSHFLLFILVVIVAMANLIPFIDIAYPQSFGTIHIILMIGSFIVGVFNKDNL